MYWLDALYLLGLRIYALVILTRLARVYKTAISPKRLIEDREKVTINNLHKVVHQLSIAAKTYDLE